MFDKHKLLYTFRGLVDQFDYKAALWYKRLEKQKLKWPSNIDCNEFELTDEQFKWLLSGFDVLGHQELHYQSML